MPLGELHELREQRYSPTMPPPRRLPPPWTVVEMPESFIVQDASGQQLAYFYFEDEPQWQMSMKRLTRDEAFLLALNFATLPRVPPQLLKEIPRPPYSVAVGLD